MPETGIGFFPDVGATWLLSRPNREWGTYLGLTGTTVGAAAALAAGLADLHVPHARLEALATALSVLPAGSSPERIDDILAGFSTPPAADVTEDMRAVVENAFVRTTVEDIIDALAETAGDFGAATAALLTTRSPTSLKVTLRLLRQARASRNLDACLAMEFAATHAVLKSPDFYEGIRAAVIDKDRRPKWAPAALHEVDESLVDTYFAPHPRPLFEQ
jgi:enoyl-CoA hydratase